MAVDLLVDIADIIAEPVAGSVSIRPAGRATLYRADGQIIAAVNATETLGTGGTPTTVIFPGVPTSNDPALRADSQGYALEVTAHLKRAERRQGNVTPTTLRWVVLVEGSGTVELSALAQVELSPPGPPALGGDLTETVQDIVGALIVAGVGTTVSYDDTAGTVTINATAGGGGSTDPEIVRDVIGSAMVAGSGIQVTVNDAGDTITIASTAVLPTRKIQAGTGLSGGGDLSADRTLSISYGTTAGTAAQGNDPRLSNARTPTAHTHAADDVTDLAAAVTAATEDSTLAYAFGAAQGVPISPWKPAPAIGPNFWQAGNFVIDANYPTPNPIDPFASGGDGSMTTTATGSQIEKRAQAKLLLGGNTVNQDNTYRVEFDIDGTGITGGWWNVRVGIRKTSGDTLYGNLQTVASHDSPAGSKKRRFIMDFKPRWDVAYLALEVRVKVLNNVPAGQTLVVENIQVTQTGHQSMHLRVAGGDPVHVVTPAEVEPRKGRALVSSSTELGSASVTWMNGINAYPSDSPWRYKMPDPSFTRAPGDSEPVGQADFVGGDPVSKTMRVGNNDQIIQAKSLNGNYEGADGGLYGNVHGGETNRTPATYKADYGAGFVPVDLAADGVREMWRLQVDWKSQMKCDSDPDPFAHVDHLMTFFPDGMMRMDRTTTFQRETTVKDVFEWMASYNGQAIGRVGRGLTVLGDVDYYPKLPTPAVPTVTIGSGGSLPAGAISYRVTALSATGETTASPAGTATATASSTATITWTAVTGATGYRVYGRTAGNEALLATLGPGALTWNDDGAVAATGLPPTTSTARSGTGELGDSAEGEDVTWAVYLRGQWCQGNIYDRDSVLSRDGVSAVRTRLMCKPGAIQKNYANLFYDNDSYELTVPAGTVWTATHWSFVYRPRDLENYHDEIAVRAASLEALKSIYPND